MITWITKTIIKIIATLIAGIISFLFLFILLLIYNKKLVDEFKVLTNIFEFIWK